MKRLGNHRLSQPQLRHLANLEPDPIAEDDDYVANAGSEPQAPEERPLSPRQLALWKAVQEAKVQGISLREIARQLGISRNTVRKYAPALTQPTNRPHNRGASITTTDCQIWCLILRIRPRVRNRGKLMAVRFRS